MQRRGLLHGDSELIYFFSAASFSRRNDGNGVTSSDVFSYWRDENTGEILLKSAAYKDIEDISVKYGQSQNDYTVITVELKQGTSFVLYASREKGKDKLFVEAIRDRLDRQ